MKTKMPANKKRGKKALDLDSMPTTYVDRGSVKRLIETIPDPELRLIIGLSRYCGLNVPHEVLSLTWECILWSKKRIFVETHAANPRKEKRSRVIPLFEEIYPLLEAVYEQAEQDENPFVITRWRKNMDALKKGQNSLGDVLQNRIARLFSAIQISFVDDLLHSTASLSAIDEWMGYDSENTLTDKDYALFVGK